jgi:hypothetical protein
MEAAMRAHVREVEAPAETPGLEELIAEELPGEERSPVPPAGDSTPAPTVDGHALTAHDLGPNGDVVLDILARAARLTADEARDLERDATWRWGFLSIAAAVIAPAGANLPISRALARARGRADGRGEAIAALDSAVAAIIRGRSGARSRAILVACIGNAGLAVLVRDLIDQETFDVLFGPWREIMHH